MDAAAPVEKKSAHRWYALGVLTLLYTFYNVDRNLVIILSEPIREEFQLSDTQLGLLTGMSFAVAFALAGIPLGFLVDRVHRTKLLAVLLTIWSVVTAACAFVRSFSVLLVTRVAVGAAESGAAPAALSIISDYFPKDQRGRAIGIFYLATPIGLALGFAIGGFLAGAVGWRNVFLLAGIPGVILALIVAFTVREPKRGAFEAPSRGKPLTSSLGAVAGVLMRRKTLLLLLLAAITMIMGQAGLSAFLPSLLRREFGMQIEQVGVFMALIHGLGGAIGMPAGGFLSDFVSKRSVAIAPRIVGLIVLVAAPLALFGCFAGDVWTAGACFFVYSVLVHMYLGPTLATYLTIAPVELRGAMSAAMLVGMNLIGTGVGPQLTGVWSDLLSNAGIEQPLRIALALATSWFFLSAIFYLAASGSATKDAAAVDVGEQSPADAATA